MDKSILKSPNLERLLRAGEIAEILSVSKAFVYQLMQKGLIRTVRIGSSRRVRLEDLSLFIEENTDTNKLGLAK